jgi:RNA polymerase sigma-70 factor, ECF subfamily
LGDIALLTPVRKEKPAERTAPTSVVRELHPNRGLHDASLVAEILRGSTDAAGTFFDRYGNHVERLLWSLLGPENEAEDLLHEVFVRALEGMSDLEDPTRLRSWLTGITVHTAREWIRRRVRRKWLRFVEELPDTPVLSASEEVNEATRCTYEILRGMSTDDRLVFSLRFIEGLEMADVAVACDVSLSTAKRRLKDAEKHFLARAKRFAALRPWIEEGGRWAID